MNRYMLESVTFDEATETWSGTYRGVPFTSDPDLVMLKWPDGRWRTLSWASKRAAQFNGDVRSLVVYLWGTSPRAAAAPATSSPA